MRRRYAHYLHEESQEDLCRKQRRALTVKWLTKERSYRMYNDRNPDGTQYDWAKEASCQAGRARYLLRSTAASSRICEALDIFLKHIRAGTSHVHVTTHAIILKARNRFEKELRSFAMCLRWSKNLAAYAKQQALKYHQWLPAVHQCERACFVLPRENANRRNAGACEKTDLEDPQGTS